jgi:tRNA G18 (ribose-2'-O)-methylase SpoU
VVDAIAIDDPLDPRIAVFRDVQERDLVGRRGGFIAEGEVVLRALARPGRHRIRRVLIAEKRLGHLAPVIDGLGFGVEVFAARQGVMDAIAGFHIHRGILAFGEQGEAPAAEALLAAAPARAVVLVLFGLANHDNIGGVFRNAAAFGAHAVLIDADCCDPLYRKAIRVSVGATLLVPFARLQRGEDALSLLSSAGFAALALSPTGGAPLIDLAPPERAAVLLGAEGPGLAPGILAQTRRISIPMAGAFDSLNVATTSGVVLHHLASSPGVSWKSDPGACGA